LFDFYAAATAAVARESTPLDSTAHAILVSDLSPGRSSIVAVLNCWHISAETRRAAESLKSRLEKQLAAASDSSKRTFPMMARHDLSGGRLFRESGTRSMT
jgi:hypothetical protein